MKKKLVLGLMMSMLLATLGGCGQTETLNPKDDSSEIQQTSVVDNQKEDDTTTIKKEGYPIAEQTMKLSVLSASADIVTDPEKCDIHNEIAELTNVDVEWELINPVNWPDKKGLVLARTELPDVMMFLTSTLSDAEYLTLVDAEKLVAIDEYLEYAPNFCTVLENSPGLREALTSSDGHIYAFPYFMGTGETYACMTDVVTYINQEWLDKVGLGLPTTTEELKEVLVAFKEKDPNGNGIADEIPLTGVKGMNLFDDWFGAFGIIPSANELGVKNLTVMDGEVVYAPTRDEYRAALDYFHELWELGVIDPEVFTQDWAMHDAKLITETRVAGMFGAWRGTAWRLSDDDVEYSILPALTGPDGDCLYRQRYSGIVSRAGTMITTDCENIELAMRWVDTLIDPKYSYQMLSDQREGYHYVDNGGEKFDILRSPDVNDPTENALVDMRMVCMDWTTVAKQPDDPNPLSVGNEKAISDAIYMPYYPKEHYPNVFLTLEEGSKVAEIAADLELYMDEFYANWISDGGDDAAWEKHLKQLEKLGVNEWVDVYTEAYNRYNGS